MCIQEYIAYQCGHRTPGVVRPCPLTTAGHNFPICTIQPSKQHLAQTMCGPCERLLHSRWVLIREWEHRWLHERGVCGCDVVFPGLLTRPRVIGNVSGSKEENVIAERGTRGDTIGHYHGSTTTTTSRGDTAQAEEEAHQQGQGRTGTETAHHIPPLFTETTVAGGNQQRVAIRLPSLYAAEWLTDHRALHGSGGCHCPVQFTLFQPEVGEHDMSAEEREFLEEYRQTESRNRAISESEEEVALRMAQINDAFGLFDPAAATATSIPPANKPPLPVSELPPTGPRRARAHSHRCQSQGHGSHHQQFHHHHQGQVAHDHSHQRYATPSTSAINTNVPFPQGQSFDTPAQYHQQQQPTFAQADQMVQLSISTTQGGGTHANNIPHHAAAPSVYANNEQYIHGPHTFVPMGIIFPDDQDHYLDDPETQDEQQHQHQMHRQEQLRSLTTPPFLSPFLFCGLPVGSGPEGSEVHMPEWEKCPLRRCRSSFQPGARTGVLPETNIVGAETSTTGNGNENENNHESFVSETQVGHTGQESHQASSLGEGHQGHQRSSSYS